MRLTHFVFAGALLVTSQTMAGTVVAPGPVSNSAGSLISLPGLSRLINGGATRDALPVYVGRESPAAPKLLELARTIVNAGGELGGVRALVFPDGRSAFLKGVTVRIANPDGSISELKVSMEIDL